jgi:hypothetical protein
MHMQKPAITFRCRGRSDRTEMHVVSVEGRRAECSCQGVDWCSHIDATLLAGERYMVPREDRRMADKAQRSLHGILRAPEGWQASWRDDRVWRGLAPPRSGELERIRWDGRPTICFLGSGEDGPRSEYVEQASSLGWRVIETATPLTTLVVSNGVGLESKRGEAASALDLPLLDYGQWREWCYEFTNAVMDRIDEHGHDPAGGRRQAA